MIEIVTSFFILLGAFFILAGSIGVIRLPDVYCRMHAATKSVTLGVASVMVASLFYFAAHGQGFSGKNLLAIIFVLLTAPVGAHMISRAAYHFGIEIWEGSVKDELKAECKYVKATSADE